MNQLASVNEEEEYAEEIAERQRRTQEVMQGVQAALNVMATQAVATWGIGRAELVIEQEDGITVLRFRPRSFITPQPTKEVPDKQE